MKRVPLFAAITFLALNALACSGGNQNELCEFRVTRLDFEGSARQAFLYIQAPNGNTFNAGGVYLSENSEGNIGNQLGASSVSIHASDGTRLFRISDLGMTETLGFAGSFVDEFCPGQGDEAEVALTNYEVAINEASGGNTIR